MALREMKVQRTRQAIVAVGAELFLSQGYDATTMEQIAERAEVGKSTLYRYFPTKEDVLLGSFSARMGVTAELVRSRPADEDLSVVLGHVVRAYVQVNDAATRELRAIIDAHPAARAKVWDLVAQEQALLEAALAERLGLDAPDLGVVMSARIATTLAVVASENVLGDHRPLDERIERILRDLDHAEIVFPSAPSGV